MSGSENQLTSNVLNDLLSWVLVAPIRIYCESPVAAYALRDVRGYIRRGLFFSPTDSNLLDAYETSCSNVRLITSRLISGILSLSAITDVLQLQACCA
jgi:hypothetical protein